MADTPESIRAAAAAEANRRWWENHWKERDAAVAKQEKAQKDFEEKWGSSPSSQSGNSGSEPLSTDGYAGRLTKDEIKKILEAEEKRNKVIIVGIFSVIALGILGIASMSFVSEYMEKRERMKPWPKDAAHGYHDGDIGKRYAQKIAAPSIADLKEIWGPMEINAPANGAGEMLAHYLDDIFYNKKDPASWGLEKLDFRMLARAKEELGMAENRTIDEGRKARLNEMYSVFRSELEGREVKTAPDHSLYSKTEALRYGSGLDMVKYWSWKDLSRGIEICDYKIKYSIDPKYKWQYAKDALANELDARQRERGK